MYTWLVELTFGLAGVLSTVTMASPYDPRISAQLIRLRKFRWNRLFLSRVNLELRPGVECDIARASSMGRAGRKRPMALVHGSLSMIGYP